MKPYITILLNKTGTEIEVDSQLLSKEELSQLNKILFDYSWEVEGGFRANKYGDGGVDWIFYLYTTDHGEFSEKYAKDSIEQVREDLVELITNALPSKSIKCVGFDIH
jgi:hypothetical protein